MLDLIFVCFRLDDNVCVCSFRVRMQLVELHREG